MAHNADEILANIKQFKIPGWTDVSAGQIKVTPIGDGNMNITLKVDKINGTTDEDAKSLVYKTYGGNVYEKLAEEMGYKVNSPVVQSLIFYEMSKRGWGPKLYGLFDGGRVEEFVDCHTLSGQEAFTPEISRDVAKAYARFHSLKLPIVQNNCDMLTILSPSVDVAKRELAEFLKPMNLKEPDPSMCFQRLHDFPFQKETDWINSIRPKIKQRTVLATMDPNYPNRLVRNQRPSDPSATRTLIIDFDLTSYSHRGYDLGGHFVLRIIGEGGLTLSDLPHPTEEQQINFLTAYMEEAEKLFDDFDKSSLDSLDNLMLESELGALVYIITVCMFLIKSHAAFESKPAIATLIDPLLTLYKQLKEKFCAKHQNLAD